MALAILLNLPSIWTGWQFDDWLHRAVLLQTPQGTELFGGPFDMFNFFSGDAARAQRQIESGIFPWWTDPSAKARFFRPVTVLTHLADIKLWPDNAALMHLHSIVWYLGVVLAATLVARRIEGAGAMAGLVAVLYAIDEGHAYPVSWLANRNAIVATFFALIALAEHDRWRKQGHPFAGILSTVSFALALAASEAGVGAAAYLFSYAVFLDRANLPARALSLCPYIAVGLIWIYARHVGNYGTYGLAIYADPIAEPGRFLGFLRENFPLLFSSLWGGPPPELSIMMAPGLKRIFWIGNIALGSFVIAVLWPIIRRDATSRFWALGAMLSLIPICATFPNSRLLLLAGLGANALIARVLGLALGGGEPATGRAPSLGLRLLFYFFLVTQLLLPPLLSPMLSVAPASVAPYINAPAQSLEAFPDLAHRDVVVVNAPGAFFAAMIPMVRSGREQAAPKSFRCLAGGTWPIEIRRIDDKSILVRPEGGFFPINGSPAGSTAMTIPQMNMSYIPQVIDRLTLGDRADFVEGETVRTKGMAAIVTEVSEDGRPAAVIFKFDRDLEGPSFLWLQWEDSALVPLTLPAVGETIVLPATPMPF